MNKKKSKPLKIAMIAPPWLDMYKGCFFGIENVVHNLTEQLVQDGHHVELFTVSKTKTKANKIHWFHKENQYKYLFAPMHHTASILISHILYSLDEIQKQGDFDIIHDHNNFVGPGMMAHLNRTFPPVIHTLHQPFTDDGLVAAGTPDNRLMFQELENAENLYFNFISEKQKEMAPSELTTRVLSLIYNGIKVDEYHYTAEKSDYWLHVGNLSKGQGVAAKVCFELNEKLKFAGIISGELENQEMLQKELDNPASAFWIKDDFKQFSKEVVPYMKNGHIEFVGTIVGQRKLEMFGKAKGMLFPILWEEPFGIVAIEALASGTPVVGYNRGAMPEIIEHGVNGFLANNEEELKLYMRRIDEIDPEQCRNTVKEKFSIEIMARKYEQLYHRILVRERKN